MQAEKIDAFVNAYWKEPRKFTYDDTIHAQREDYHNQLKKKYGRQIWKEYGELVGKLVEQDTTEASLAVCDFVFKHGMCEDVVPETSIRGRETLISLLKYLSQREKPFTLADMGSGCGKLTAGLAAGLDKLTTVYANEISINGLQRMQAHIDELPAETKENTRKKINPVHGDYETKDVQEKLSDADVFLAAYPQYNYATMIPNLARIANGAEIILCYPFDTSELVAKFASWVHDEIKELHENDYNEIANEHGYKFSVVDQYGHLPEEMIIIASGKKADLGK